MRLTPLDIKKQDFKRVMRGLDPDEVQEYLQMLADQWQELTEENRRLERRIIEIESKLVHYKEVEEAMQEALKTARHTSRQTLESAKARARGIVEEAVAAATRIEKKAQDEKYNLRRDIERIRSRRVEVIARLRALLRSELAILDDHVQQYPAERDDTAVEDLDRTNAVSRSLGNPEPADDAVKAVEHLEAATEFRHEESVPVAEHVEDAVNEGHFRDEARGGRFQDKAGEGHLQDTAREGHFGDAADEDTLRFGSSENEQSNQDGRPGADDAHQPSAGQSQQHEGRQNSPEMDKIRKILDDLA